MSELLCDIHHRIGHTDLALKIDASDRFIAIEGPSGAGKTSLLQVLAGLIRPRQATIRFRGMIWQDQSCFVKPWKRNVVWMPQDALLFPHLTVAGNLGFARRIDGESVDELSRILGIASLAQRFPRNLSGGERQRVALVRALATRADLVLLDEPFSALDRELRRAAIDLVKERITATGATLVLVSHHLNEVGDWPGTKLVVENGAVATPAPV